MARASGHTGTSALCAKTMRSLRHFLHSSHTAIVRQWCLFVFKMRVGGEYNSGQGRGLHFCRRQSHSQTLQRGRRRWRGRRRRRDGVGRGVGRLPCSRARAAVCAARARCAHRTPYGGKQTARGARRQRRSARAARATEGRSSDRWRCRCSVCPGAPSARGARQERGQAWRRGDTRLRRRAGEGSVRGEAAGEGAAGGGAREQPTPDASL